jgi:glucose/mannose-6-phosphate isomerase
VPEGLSAFEATGFEMGALVNLYDSIGVKGLKDTVKQMIPKLKQYRDEIWSSKDIWKLAMKVNGAIPVIYSSGELRAVHKRWKFLLNSVMGRLAFSGEIPEFDHNEIVSWTEDDDSKEFIIIII